MTSTTLAAMCKTKRTHRNSLKLKPVDQQLSNNLHENRKMGCSIKFQPSCPVSKDDGPQHCSVDFALKETLSARTVLSLKGVAGVCSSPSGLRMLGPKALTVLL